METLAAEKTAFEEEKKAHTELYETQQQVCGQFLVTGYKSSTHPHNHITPSHITHSHTLIGVKGAVGLPQAAERGMAGEAEDRERCRKKEHCKREGGWYQPLADK